jgi:hypothetical protein
MPRKDKKSDPKPSPARESVLRHLKTAALAGASLALACKGPSAGGTDPNKNEPQEPPPPTSHRDGPPIVCDPLPPPVNCEAISDSAYLITFLSKEAKVVRTEKGMGVELSVTAGYGPQQESLRFPQKPKLKGAEAIKVELLGAQLRVVFIPEKGAKKVTVEAPLACGERSTVVTFEVDVSAKPVEGQLLDAGFAQK